MKIVVVGLGYVGLPLAVRLADSFETWGLDIDKDRVSELRAGHDRTNEIERERLTASSLNIVDSADACPAVDAYIVTVPTPIDDAKQPDLRPVVSATKSVASMINPARRPVIVYESTVYPGVTEDLCGPLLEQAGLKRGRDFTLGYSPERINPGDREHTVDRIVKVIAGEDAETTEKLAEIYGRVTSAGVFRASSIKVAEAAKVIENAQRDINIAFMNEITQIFARLDMSVWDVLDAAQTKWNFLPFTPGLVGGHCIGVDPYYLSYRAHELGLPAKIVLAGRGMNDGMGAWIAGEISARRGVNGGRALVLGLTFKEDVPDLRNSKVIDVIRALEDKGYSVDVHDPLADAAEALHEYGIELTTLLPDTPYDLIVGAVPHAQYKVGDVGSWAERLSANGILADIKRIWPKGRAVLGDRYWSL